MGAGLHMQQRCGSAYDIKHGACMGHFSTSCRLQHQAMPYCAKRPDSSCWYLGVKDRVAAE